MAINIKFTKFDNAPWGFRLAGGSDFPQPLTVIRVIEGSLAECMGLKVGDIAVRLNDRPISSLTHGQAHEALKHAGNNFVLGVQREEETQKAAEAISEENIVPYRIALADLPPVFPEEILKEETVIERCEEEKIVVEQLSVEEEVRRGEAKLAEKKPVDANSEIVPNKNLTDDEIAQLILEEEELLSDQGLLGVNFKKLRPRASILKSSKVLEELQNIATAEPERIQELKRASTFLRKPQRPVPKPRREQKVEEDDGETYKVVIKKQDKKTVIARLVEKGLLPPGSETIHARTPEPSEVKMHETDNSPGDRSPLVSDSNSSCSTSPFDGTYDVTSFSCCSEFESSEIPFEDQPARRASYKCKSKLFHTKPSYYRRYSSPGGYNDTKTKSPIKGYYLENILRGCARSCAPRYQRIDGQLDEIAETKGDACLGKYDWLKNIGFDGLLPSERTRTTRRCARAHYAERILLRNVNAVARHFCSAPRTTRGVSRAKRCRTKGKYIATYLERERARLMSLVTTLFQFLLRRPDVSESMNMLEVRRKRRMSYKGRYFEHVLQKNVTPVLQSVKETSSVYERKDGPKSTRTKGRYIEKCLHRQNLGLRLALTSLFCRTKTSLDNIFGIDTSSKVRRGRSRGRYFERFVRRNVEIFEMVAEYVCSRIFEWLEKAPLCVSRKEFPVVTLGAPNCTVDDLVPNQVDEDVRDEKIFERHEDGPSCPSQKESFAVVSIDNPVSNEENIDENDDNVPEEVESSEPTDALVENEDTVSKFLKSAEDYISTEVFHRGSKRLSRPRKSIDVVPNEDDKGFPRLLQSTEDYISTEVFHRGGRRLSKSRKSIHVLPKEDDTSLSKLPRSAEDCVSTEVFHRGSGRFSRSSTGVLSTLLRSTGDYVSNEVFHRRSGRLSKSSRRESISLVAPALWDGFKSVHFNLPWFSLRITDKSATKYDVCEKKVDADIELDNRRLSFVPTILYKGITNRIGVDFTRLIAYAFVPCTSLVLLYMYR